MGVNALFHDLSAALVVDGRPVAAAEEERFSRRSTANAPCPSRPGSAGAVHALVSRARGPGAAGPRCRGVPLRPATGQAGGGHGARRPPTPRRLYAERASGVHHVRVARFGPVEGALCRAPRRPRGVGRLGRPRRVQPAGRPAFSCSTAEASRLPTCPEQEDDAWTPWRLSSCRTLWACSTSH